MNYKLLLITCLATLLLSACQSLNLPINELFNGTDSKKNLSTETLLRKTVDYVNMDSTEQDAFCKMLKAQEQTWETIWLLNSTHLTKKPCQKLILPLTNVKSAETAANSKTLIRNYQTLWLKKIKRLQTEKRSYRTKNKQLRRKLEAIKLENQLLQSKIEALKAIEKRIHDKRNEP